jgi:hypothetical protein
LFHAALSCARITAYREISHRPRSDRNWPARYTGYAMPSEPPTLIAIDHDDYHADRVGTTEDGMQFFVTMPFIAALGDEAGRVPCCISF